MCKQIIWYIVKLTFMTIKYIIYVEGNNLERQRIKLDIYDNKVCNALYKCQDGERFCKSMASKLVFYDSQEILFMHSESINKHDQKYDISKLKKVEFLESGEKVEKVVSLESHWIAVLISNKKEKKTSYKKILYVSPDGEGYFSDDFESANKGLVSENVLVEYAYDYPNGIYRLGERFFDGKHNEFLKSYYDAMRKKITQIFADILDNPSIKLEDIYPMIVEGLKDKENKEKFNFAKFLDFAYSQFLIDEIIKFEKEYADLVSKKQPYSE